MIFDILGLFCIFLVVVVVGGIWRRRQSRADQVADQKIELEQIIARHNAMKAKQADSQKEQK